MKKKRGRPWKVAEKGRAAVQLVPEIDECQRIFRAVIIQALYDLKNSGKQNKKEVREWMGDTEDFLMVCSFAGLEPEAVKLAATKPVTFTLESLHDYFTVGDTCGIV